MKVKSLVRKTVTIPRHGQLGRNQVLPAGTVFDVIRAHPNGEYYCYVFGASSPHTITFRPGQAEPIK